MIGKIKAYINKVVDFLTYDIWRVSRKDNSAGKMNLYNIIKAFILAIRNINGSQLNTRASALTYSTLLSIVPLLAVLFAIARGFGFQNIVKSQLFRYFEGQQVMLEKTMALIDKSLEYAQGGVFLGVGIILLLYTVVNLLSNIEDNFNTIWNIKKGRSYYRMFTDYLALFLITPIFIVCSAGVSIILSSNVDIPVVGYAVNIILKIIPFVLTVFFFVFFNIYIPNTKVKFSAALFGGIFTGICFQIFQLLYISGQIWISKYNAIYGSFAALPLLLLWLQLSWFMCLFGVELTYAYQNVNKFDFEHETNNISKRYKDFVVLLIATLIVKRFETEKAPYTADELSQTYKIPTKLTYDTLYTLQEINIITETQSKVELIPAYIPAIDINLITVAYLFTKIDLYGSEDFIIDTKKKFASEWHAILNIREIVAKNSNTLLKDL